MYAKRTLYAIVALFTTLALAATGVEGRTAPAQPGFIPTSVQVYRLPEPVPAPLLARTDAIMRVMAHEGGYAAHPADPGGPTNFGITKRTARLYGYTGPMSRMTKADAILIYGAMWDEHGFGAIPDAEVAAQAFDAFVAHGPRGLKWIRDGPGACEYINHRRMAAYRNSRGWPTFNRGWTKRINANLARCSGHN